MGESDCFVPLIIMGETDDDMKDLLAVARAELSMVVDVEFDVIK